MKNKSIYKSIAYIISSTILVLIISVLLFSCGKKEEEKPFEPFGAEKINYDDFKNINKDGPTIESIHEENVPPFGDLQETKEVGPMRNDAMVQVVEPTADMDEEPDFGGIPIVTKEATTVRESESETDESE